MEKDHDRLLVNWQNHDVAQHDVLRLGNVFFVLNQSHIIILRPRA